METRTDAVYGATTSFSGVSSHPLEFLFHPRSVAVVGALSDPRKQGYNYVEELQLFGYRGRIYPVGPQQGDVLGLQTYPSLLSIPDEVDHVISCVPAGMAVDLMRECAAKRVRSVHLFTARLSETGDEDKRDLERQIVDIARAAGIRVIGPNCMGLYYPRGGLSFRLNFPRESGRVAFISQSGGHGAEFGYRGGLRGIRFSKIVSYGNACDLNESDFLDYFTEDPETDVIAMYVEGTKDGRRLIDALKRATAKKPVIICKAGRTESGTQAVSSHTGAMAGSDAMWDAVFRQMGALRVYELEEMADMILPFLFMRLPAGRHVGVLGGGGGGSVFAADACESQGLVVPALPVDIVEQLKVMVPDTWVLAHNPLDTSAIGPREMACRIFDMLAHHDALDFFIADGGLEWLMERQERVEEAKSTLESLLDTGRDCGKPVAVVVRSPESYDAWRLHALTEMMGTAVNAGFAVYPTVERAAGAISRFIAYHERRARLS